MACYCAMQLRDKFTPLRLQRGGRGSAFQTLYIIIVINN